MADRTHSARKEPRVGGAHVKIARHEDSYRDDLRLANFAECPRCGAVYVAGRWTWQARREGAQAHLCPACRRIEERLPGGYLAINGAFAAANRGQILSLIDARAVRERDEHPLQRLMSIDAKIDELRVATTDGRLARTLGRAIESAFKGELRVRCGEDGVTRVAWRRDR